MKRVLAGASADRNVDFEPFRIALFGPYSSRNLGDTATQMAAIQNLGRRLPGARFLGVCPEPKDTEQSLGIPAFPLSGRGSTAGSVGEFFEPRLYAGEHLAGVRTTLAAARRISHFVRTLDLLVISGGGQLDDFWGGPQAHPWSMLLWTGLARRHGVPVAYLAVGLDGLRAPLSRIYAVNALRLAEWRSFRDPASRDAMVSFGLRAPSLVCPDLAFALDVESVKLPRSSTKFVVLSPISRKTWSHDETRVHDRYLAAMSNVGRDLARKGYSIRIVCSQAVMDVEDARNLARLLSEVGVGNVTVLDSPRVADFLQNVHGADLVVASRLHAVILSLIVGCPVVAVGHLPKVGAVMHQLGMDDFSLSLKGIDGGALTDAVVSALEQTVRLRSVVNTGCARLRSDLQDTFDRIAALARCSRGRPAEPGSGIGSRIRSA